MNVPFFFPQIFKASLECSVLILVFTLKDGTPPPLWLLIDPSQLFLLDCSKKKINFWAKSTTLLKSYLSNSFMNLRWNLRKFPFLVKFLKKFVCALLIIYHQ